MLLVTAVLWEELLTNLKQVLSTKQQILYTAATAKYSDDFMTSLIHEV